MLPLVLALVLLLFGGQLLPGIAHASRVTTTGKGISVDIDEPTKPDVPRKSLQDTIWIADWTFDGGLCNSSGWSTYDGRILNNGSNYWVVDNRFNGQGGIVNNAAVLARHDLCWERDGYGNRWDYSVVLNYRGLGATLSFDFLSDSEPATDFVSVEADSAGASEALVDYALRPALRPEDYRVVLFLADGPQLAGSVLGLPLPDFGVPATIHQVYIRFESDFAASDEDGLYPSSIQAGLAVDNVLVTGTLPYTENFEGALGPNVQLLNTAPATPFGNFARLFSHVTDNDVCAENLTCSWLLSDPLRIAFLPDMAFGPGSAVVRNWLDNVFVSPWVNLGTTPSATNSLLSYRMFPGNRFDRGKIVQSWRVRARLRVDNTDTSAPGDSIDCLTSWSNESEFMHLDDFVWSTRVFDMTGRYEPSAPEIQVSFRVVDWQLLAGSGPPVPLNTGPGPFIDRVRIGRRVGTGPAMIEGPDSRTQGQDCFPTVQNGIVPGEHFSPDGANIFGTCAFSNGDDLGSNAPGSPNLITGDSITVAAIDARGAGGVTNVTWYGAITSGPHTGKAPAPYVVGGNGFFAVQGDSIRVVSGVVARNSYFVDLDDTYFRGGDVVKSFWRATDAQGGSSSLPSGLSTLPASVASAEVATGGLYEVNFLPVVNWAPAYLARIAADPHGDLAPTGPEIANSIQRSCILLVNTHVSSRKSGQTERNSFMYTLDRLGYRGFYDVYDVQGFGNTNNQIGGRANVAQVSRYALIVNDAGRLHSGTLPAGSNVDDAKIDQAGWYRAYLAQGAVGLAGTATLWAIGESFAEENRTNALLATDMGVGPVAANQNLAVNPDVVGVSSFQWASGCMTSFNGDRFALAGGCPQRADYDGLAPSGLAVVTHRYAVGTVTGSGAMLVNKNAVQGWNTVLSAFGWFDIRDPSMIVPGNPELQLATKILGCVLPVQCLRSPSPTDVPQPEVEAAPRFTTLHACVPNPFNPTTTVRFDLARRAHAKLLVYDAAGRRVTTLVDTELPAGPHAATWNGLDAHGRRVPSGVYFARLSDGAVVASRKMVLLE